MRKPLTETPLPELEARALKLDQHVVTELGKKRHTKKAEHYFSLLQAGTKPVLGSAS